MNLYVSKLGDNSDGSSWAQAFHSIQQVLLAVPDCGFENYTAARFL